MSILPNESAARAGKLLVARQKVGMTPDFVNAVALITHQKNNQTFQTVFLHQPVTNEASNNVQGEVIDWLIRDSVIDGADELKLPVMAGSPIDSPQDFTHPGLGKNPTDGLNGSTALTMIHTNLDAKGAQLYGDFAISRGVKACTELRGTSNKIAVLGENGWKRTTLNTHFRQGVWAQCIDATRDIVCESSPLEIFRKSRSIVTHARRP